MYKYIALLVILTKCLKATINLNLLSTNNLQKLILEFVQLKRKTGNVFSPKPMTICHCQSLHVECKPDGLEKLIELLLVII